MHNNDMAAQHLRSALQGAVERGLPSIQQAFDDYQRECFTDRPAEFFALELCGEAGELANLEKKRWRGSTVDDAHAAFEAADVFIALMNFCNARGVNLEAAVREKLGLIPPNRYRE
jgi:NTP pyrophosphatase (non-canonical NTP hydrolase)